MMDFLRAQAATIELLSQVVTLIAVVPSAIWFLVNQEGQRRHRKRLNHRLAIQRYNDFLKLCLNYPRLSLYPGAPRDKRELSAEELIQRDTLLEMLTSLFEFAYTTYRSSRNAYKAEQWGGWDAFISEYCARSDYQEWFERVVFGSDSGKYFGAKLTQYDSRFETYIYRRLKQHWPRGTVG